MTPPPAAKRALELQEAKRVQVELLLEAEAACGAAAVKPLKQEPPSPPCTC
jgi:hypothetical protein